MVDKYGVCYLLISVGHLYCKHVSIPGRQEHNRPRLHDLIEIPLLIPYGALTIKYHQGLLRKIVLLPEGHLYVVPGVWDTISLHTKGPPCQPLYPLWTFTRVYLGYHQISRYHSKHYTVMQVREGRTSWLTPSILFPSIKWIHTNTRRWWLDTRWVPYTGPPRTSTQLRLIRRWSISTGVSSNPRSQLALNLASSPTVNRRTPQHPI